MSKKDDDPWVRTFDVTEPQKHKKGYTIYKVISKVYPKNSVEAVTQVIVWKRYNDFKKLHKSLSTIHQNLYLKGTFPKFAEARFFGRFAADVIEERRKSAFQLLEFAAQHPPLFTSQVFVKFFEDGQYIKPSEKKEEFPSKPLSPIKVHSEISPNLSSANTNENKNDVETASLLGGIWEHCQTADDISLSSHPSDDDDRTTFTDEDSVKGTPLPNSDLAFFDPLLEKKSDLLTSLEGENNSWLLSAIQSCTYLHPDDQTSSPTLSLPKPFAELDREENESNEKFDRETSVSQIIPDLQEFDPLLDSHHTSDNEQTESLASLSEQLPSPLTAAENTYLFDAANLISQAHEFEASGDFVSAFGYYKAAIGILLQGVQGDANATQREAVRRKTAQYLSRAEEIYGRHVVGQLKDENRWANDSRISVASTLELNIGSLRGSLGELGNYKVLGIIDHVLLVLDTTTNATYIIKALYKRPDSKNCNSPNIVPQEIPYMVQLHRVYETDYAIFLLLQHASGGRLWDYVNSYLQRSPMSPCIDCGVPFPDFMTDNKKDQNVTVNVYSGKKLSTNSEKSNSLVKNKDLLSVKETSNSISSHSSVDSDLEPAPICPSSYTALFKKYAASVKSGRTVELAKCHINFQMDEEDSDDKQSTDDDGDNDNQSDQLVTVCQDESPNILSSEDQNTEMLQNISHPKNSPKEHHIFVEKDNNLPDLINDHVATTNDGIELLITNSRTLLQNVEETLKATYPNSNNVAKDNITMHDVVSHYEDIISGGDKEQKNSNKEKSFVSDKTDSKKYKPSQSNCSRMLLMNHQSECLSSSAGSVGSQRVRHLSEVFQQLTTSASTHPYLPESCVRVWMAELIIALIHLHNLGLAWQDLRPDNILLGERGHILLTYQSSWNCMDHTINSYAKENLYAAPEIGGIDRITCACDWWSVGALMFELLTGRSVVSCHPGGITAHTSINIPAHISLEARDLLKNFLEYSVSKRLGSGPHGVEDIKSHPFFYGYDWKKADY